MPVMLIVSRSMIASSGVCGGWIPSLGINLYTPYPYVKLDAARQERERRAAPPASEVGRDRQEDEGVLGEVVELVPTPPADVVELEHRVLGRPEVEAHRQLRAGLSGALGVEVDVVVSALHGECRGGHRAHPAASERHDGVEVRPSLSRGVDAREPRRHVDRRERRFPTESYAEELRLRVQRDDGEVAPLVDARSLLVEDVVRPPMRRGAELEAHAWTHCQSADERRRTVVVLEVAASERDSRSGLGLGDQPVVESVGRVELVGESTGAREAELPERAEAGLRERDAEEVGGDERPIGELVERA